MQFFLHHGSSYIYQQQQEAVTPFSPRQRGFVHTAEVNTEGQLPDLTGIPKQVYKPQLLHVPQASSLVSISFQQDCQHGFNLLMVLCCLQS